MDIIVDPRFRDKIPKPTAEEFRQLEENILSDGLIRDPLILWQGHNILIDGHNRWRIYQSHSDSLPFPNVRELAFDDENAAIDWMLMNQLGRRNLNEMQITALRGQLYKTMKKSHGKGKFKTQNFVSRLKKVSPVAIVRDGRVSSAPGASKYARQILGWYNRNAKDRLPDLL